MSFKSNKLTPICINLGGGSLDNKAAEFSPNRQSVVTFQQQRQLHKNKNENSNNRQHDHKRLQHLYVLPVLLLEFLALALTRAVIPELLLESFGDNIYFVMGCAECVRGLLAFISCPLFGKISDYVGRKVCLLITVFGTCLPVCTLAVLTWQTNTGSSSLHGKYGIDYGASTTASFDISSPETTADEESEMTQQRMRYFVLLFALSGIFSSTFTLTFAYISDTVRKRKDRVSAYGLALATFGLSFTIGPMAGGYLAHIEVDGAVDVVGIEGNAEGIGAIGKGEVLETPSSMTIHPLGQQRVFTASLVLTIIDLLYIYFVLPESKTHSKTHTTRTYDSRTDDEQSYASDDSDCVSQRSTLSQKWNHVRTDIIPNSWSPFDTLRIFSGDPFLYEVGAIAFLYYTALHALVSTLQLYAVKRFRLRPERLGELMSALGLSTMVSEAVLVRIVVPAIGEKRSMRFGLACFVVQCAILGIAYEGWHLFVCVLVSMGSNLVYPSLTSLVSEAVGEDMVGEALGAINGVKALTEGLGPLIFGALMTFSEHSALPGWPYLVAAMFAAFAYKRSRLLPDEDDEQYISESYVGHRQNGKEKISTSLITALNVIINSPIKPFKAKTNAKDGVEMRGGDRQGQRDEEFVGLLSEVDEVDEGGFLSNYNEQISLGGSFDAVAADDVGN